MSARNWLWCLCWIGLVVAVQAALSRASPKREVTVQLGPCGASRQGMRLSLQRLAAEIRNHPQAQVYRIYRTRYWLTWDDMDRWVTTYNRRKGRLSNDHLGTGRLEDWDQVTDQAIQATASSPRGFKDLKKYGCRDIHP